MVLMMVFVASASGCTWFSPKPPREPLAMLQAGVTNLASKTSSEYELNLDATLLGKDSDGKAQNLNIDLSASGDSDSDPAALAMNMKVKGNMSVNQDKYTLNSELRANTKAIYALLNGLTGPAAEIPKEYVAQALGKWWKIPLPEAMVKSVTGSGESLAARLVASENVFKNVSGFVKDIVYDGSDTIGGLESYSYRASLDSAKLRDFMIQYNKDNGSEPTAEELAKLDDFLAHFSSTLTFWVSVEGEVLDRVKVALKMDKVLSEDGKSSGKGNIAFDISSRNFGKKVSLVEPVGATEFDLFGMLGGLSGLGASTFETDVTPSVAPALKK